MLKQIKNEICHLLQNTVRSDDIYIPENRIRISH